MKNWVGTLSAHVAAHRTAVLVSVAAAKGSVPRPPGTRMIVTADGIDGTIGGGHLEHKAIAIARDLLAARGPLALLRIPLAASLGQCCGGLAHLLFEPVHGDSRWLEALGALRAAGKACALVSPVRGAGEGRLIVTADATHGTLGSSERDVAATTLARTILGGVGSAGLATLGAPSGLEVFVDVLRPPDFSVVLCGAGHVGRAVVRALADLDCRVRWVDGRDDAFPESIPDNVEPMITDTPEAEVAAASPGAYFLVMTHSHPLDEALSECILRRGHFAYFGLIGSQSKRRQFEKRLEARGVSKAQLETMTCPIGIEGITGKEPEVIAIAVAAEMLRARSKIGSRERAQARGEPANANHAATRRCA
jgi:xanthine dehydrogenase accessory factor